MTYPHREGDLEVDQLLKKMDELVSKGFIVHVKWTCPKCGERVTATDPDEFHPEGYTHSEKADGSPCGEFYVGPWWGIHAIFTL